MGKPDVIAAIATPLGRGAIGVVRLSGPDLAPFMTGLFGRPLIPRLATFTKFLDASGGVLDSGIGLYFKSPNSYTGEDIVELQGHGGTGVLKLVLARCVELGARIAEPGEFTKRAFLNGKIDLAQAEAVADVIDAHSEAAARAGTRTLTGVLSETVTALQALLLGLRIELEAQIDFPEDPVGQFDAAALAGRIEEAIDQTRSMLTRARRGAKVREGIRVAIVGAPNVGKSTLLNYLAGESVAIVTDIPGTTRDVVSAEVMLEGIPVTLFDTAGVRASTDPVEAIGVSRALEVARHSDVVLDVCDVSSEAAAVTPPELLDNVRRLKVINKIDLVEKFQPMERAVYVSGKTGVGIDALRREILAVANIPVSAEGDFIARERHVVALEEALQRLESALVAAEMPDLAAEELRLSSVALGKITGQLMADELLGHIFKDFCIGK